MADYRGSEKELKNGVRRTAAQAKSSARRVKNVAKEEAATLGGQVQGLAEEAGHLARQAYDYGYERVEAGAATAREQVQQRPLAMMAAAFVGGAVLAALLRR